MGWCCENCFLDSELRAIVKLNSNSFGNCNYCEAKDVKLIEASHLESIFQTILNIYRPKQNPQSSDIHLHEMLLKDWNIFKIKDPIKIQQLVKAICPENYTTNPDLFDKPIEILDYLSTKSTEHEKKWDEFANEIKYTNRFFISNSIDLDLLARLFKRHLKSYRANTIFFRARISNKKGFKIVEMGKPPVQNSKAGRANPSGISYLYIADTPKTTLYEIRASIYDYVTIGEIRLKKQIEILSLRGIENYSPFQLDDEIEEFLIHRSYLSKLEKELSKPLRRQDSDLDYLPTQYLSEYIKYLGYDGIEYGSSLNPSGYNVAIFNDDCTECISTSIHEINSIDYKYSAV